MTSSTLDNLSDVDIDGGNLYQDVNVDMSIPLQVEESADAVLHHPKSLIDLGIDEEIKVKKARRPVPRLDDSRLLSQAGVPKLRRLAKERFRFQGKGHEYSDVANLLTIYQLWLDDLYPRAKFLDGLAIIEKLGHTKRLQTMRREWTMERKSQNESDKLEINTLTSELALQQTGVGDKQILPIRSQDHDNVPVVKSVAKSQRSMPRVADNVLRTSNSSQNGDSLFLSENEGDDRPPDDDLDALLAEDDQKDNANSPSNASNLQQETTINERMLEDEMETLAEMYDF